MAYNTQYKLTVRAYGVDANPLQEILGEPFRQIFKLDELKKYAAENFLQNMREKPPRIS